jgi:uroporphyrinogen decarboxylase
MKTRTNDAACEHRFLRALKGLPVDRVPVWLMRQAGRYLPEYRATRARAGSFMALCQSPEASCEVTMQPIDRYGFDAAILFSDILTVPHAMGLPLEFCEGEGPVFGRTVRTDADVRGLFIPDPDLELRYVMDAVRLIRTTLADRIPLIGFGGSPWTLACYMVEGRGSKTFSHIRSMMYRAPDVLHALLEKLTQATILYLQAQIAAGAQAIQVFDTWGGLLGYDTYPIFSLRYLKQIVEALNAFSGNDVPVILFTKGGGLWLKEIAATGTDGVGLDWSVDPQMARAFVGPDVTLQGNLDPAVLYGAPEQIRTCVAETLSRFRAGHPMGRLDRVIFNLGHGLTPDLTPEAVEALVAAVREFGV